MKSRSRTRKQRHFAKLKMQIAETLSPAVRQAAALGSARQVFEEEMNEIRRDFDDNGFTELQFLCLVAHCKKQCGIEYRDWLDAEIRLKADVGEAFAFMEHATGQRSSDDADNFEDDLAFYGFDNESFSWAVSSAVSAVMRPPRKRSDSV